MNHQLFMEWRGHRIEFLMCFDLPQSDLNYQSSARVGGRVKCSSVKAKTWAEFTTLPWKICTTMIWNWPNMTTARCCWLSTSPRTMSWRTETFWSWRIWSRDFRMVKVERKNCFLSFLKRNFSQTFRFSFFLAVSSATQCPSAKAPRYSVGANSKASSSRKFSRWCAMKWNVSDDSSS